MARERYRILDVSLPISPQLTTYPGDPLPSIDRVYSLEKGDAANVSRLALGTHAGTHTDPPIHFEPDGLSVDQVPLERYVGPALVLDVQAAGYQIGRAHLEGRFHGHQRVLLKTCSAGHFGERPCPKEFAQLEASAAEYLVATRVKTIGIDTLSIGNVPVHHILLRQNVIIIEGLDLSQVDPGEYFLACLPLRIKGGDGAPARAVLIQGL